MPVWFFSVLFVVLGLIDGVLATAAVRSGTLSGFVMGVFLYAMTAACGYYFMDTIIFGYEHGFRS